MSVRLLFASGLMFAVLGVAACDKDTEPPPPDDKSDTPKTPAVKTIEIDHERSITIKADRTLTVANLVFVVQPAPAGVESFGVTLMTSRPGPDGTRLTFGTFHSAKNLEALAKDTIRFASGPMLDPTGNGIFTITAAYQPKFAEIKINSMEASEVRGTLSGEFYRFSLAARTAKPTVMKLEASFTAALVQK